MSAHDALRPDPGAGQEIPECVARKEVSVASPSLIRIEAEFEGFGARGPEAFERGRRIDAWRDVFEFVTEGCVGAFFGDGHAGGCYEDGEASAGVAADPLQLRDQASGFRERSGPLFVAKGWGGVDGDGCEAAWALSKRQQARATLTW